MVIIDVNEQLDKYAYQYEPLKLDINATHTYLYTLVTKDPWFRN